MNKSNTSSNTSALEITHEDWELLWVSDLAPYHDKRYEHAYEAHERGEEVLELLHKRLFGMSGDDCPICIAQREADYYG